MKLAWVESEESEESEEETQRSRHHTQAQLPHIQIFRRFVTLDANRLAPLADVDSLTDISLTHRGGSESRLREFVAHAGTNQRLWSGFADWPGPTNQQTWFPA